MESLITVIVPVYNTFSCLDACVTSIIKQDYTNLEIIIIDDGSTDNSLQKCLKWEAEDNRIRCVTQDNHGLGAARNKGVTLAHGEYITFIDSDDIVENDYISCLYYAIKKYNADISIAYIDSTDKKRTSIPEDVPSVCKRTEAMDLLCLCKFPSGATCKLYKTELLQKTTFIESVAYEDVLFLFEAIGKSDMVAICRRILYHYIRRTGSITQTRSVRNFLDLLKAFNDAAAYIRNQYSACDYPYIHKMVTYWFELEYSFHKYHCVKLMSKQELTYVKNELQKIRSDALQGISNSKGIKISGKAGIKLFMMKYMPLLCYPAEEVYRTIFLRC